MEQVERRLAAILAMDVVGFSRMMGADENGTLERLRAVRADITDPAIAARQGRIVKEMGDGLLVQFDSSVNAVQCAIDIQEVLRGYNAELPDDACMRMRMGINLGDVIIEGSDIYGDGVNIAARLEPIADIGGIFVSAAIHDSALKKVSAAFEDLGEVELKNIGHPVRVYRAKVAGAVAGGKLAPPRAKPAGRMWLAVGGFAAAVLVGVFVWLGGKHPEPPKPADAVKAATQQTTLAPSPAPAQTPARPVIAVLPFTNFSDDKDQEYFSDGLT